MTSILVPDFPDWVPPQSTIATDRVLYQSPVGGEALPITIVGLDVSLWTSLQVFLEGTTATAFLPASVEIAFTTQGVPVWADFTTCNLNSNETQGDSGLIRDLPVVAPQLVLVMLGSFGTNKGGLIITGSTRQSVPRTRPANVTQSSPVCLSGSQNPGTSVLTLGYAGPYGRGVSLSANSNTGHYVNCNSYALESGILTPRLVGGVLDTVNPTSMQVVEAPGSVLQVTAQRSSSTTGVCTYAVTGLE